MEEMEKMQQQKEIATKKRYSRLKGPWPWFSTLISIVIALEPLILLFISPKLGAIIFVPIGLILVVVAYKQSDTYDKWVLEKLKEYTGRSDVH